MKRISVVLFVISSVFFSQCEVLREGCMDQNALNYSVAADIPDNSCIYAEGCTNPSASNYDRNAVLDDGSCIYDSLSVGDCNPVLEGNLSVTNETGDILFLFNELSYVTCIPANTENFIVNIPNQTNSVLVLQVWKSNEVGDVADPNLDNVYRQWSVALSNTTLETERANWRITDSDVNTSSGTLLLTYPSFDEYNQEVIYQVDVYLNSKTGARLASIQPGVEDKKVSIDFGAHYLFYRYWYSDPNSPSSEITEIGWDESDYIVVNAEHKEVEIDVPVYVSVVGKYGYLNIENATADPISIFANDQLIESIAKVDGSPDGLSIIPANNSTTFLIPEQSYTITAKSLDGSTSIISFKNVNIVQSHTAELYVGGKHKEISVTNNTTEVLMLTTEDGKYLGKTMNPGEATGLYLVQNEYDSLLVVTPNNSKKKKIPATTDVVVSDLDEFVTQELIVTSAWDVIGSGHYQSPDINDNETTSMTATLFNTNRVLLSFEYKVSSEYGYDKFNFNIDGEVLINGESGDTEWKNYSVNVEPGFHNLEWIYIKDGMFSFGNDNVEIRNITIN
ncbi:MAG TPA: hypothetical protein DDX98_02510 [Bacteroidales bacterium]|jgi:archaellum component FlaF (FlaF/FlaG flagellin family)|nr:hypothetical protein [Bacteroidales bacterium]